MPEAYGFFRLRVSSVDRLTSDSAAVTFDVPAELAEEFRFRPGQHLTLRRELAGQDLRRTYSVCSSAAGGPLRVAVKRLQGGAFSGWVLDHLRPGDELEVLPPAGRFGPAVDPARSRRYGLVAAGLHPGFAFLIVAVVYLVLAAILALVGKKQVKRVGPPVRTIETTKESVAALKGTSSSASR